MKIEGGCFRVTRDGQKVGPIQRSGHHVYPWSDGTHYWTDAGRFHLGYPSHPLDLVSEWTDEPTGRSSGGRQMTDLVNDLKAAKALIDTEEKFEAMEFGVLDALAAVSLQEATIAELPRYEAMRSALLNAAGLGNLPTINRLPHADIMSLFDRAIAAAEARS